jgi:hypothetical protein
VTPGRRPARAVVLLGAGLLLSCSPAPNTLQVTVEAYISAVSLGDVGRILDICAPCQQELQAAAGGAEARTAIEKKYRDEIERAFILWEQARSTGQLQLDPLGIALIRSIGLGKEGAAAMPVGVTFSENNTRGVVHTRALTNYDRIGWDVLPSGGRMYLMGHPFGRVVNFAPGYEDPSRLQLLATVDLEWSLVRLSAHPRPAGAPSDWYVEGVRPVAGTDTAWTPPAPGS